MALDQFLFRTRAPGYDCLDFLAEVWEHETGEDLRARLGGVFERERSIRAITRDFQRLRGPGEPSIVIMQSSMPEVHVGMHTRGRVAHLLRRPEFTTLDVATRGFTRIRFYR